jgi:hypothetical protein
MELLNATRMSAGYTLGFERDGRELLIVAVKGTFAIPDRPDSEPLLADEQVPLVEADEFTGEPGLSAPKAETDYAHRKLKCDVLLSGSAHAPGGRPTERVTVSMQIGPIAKSFDVVGNRKWQAGALTLGGSRPEPFTMMPIFYDNAFGGIEKPSDDPATHRFHPENPAGVGWREHFDAKALNGTPLPNTEETGNPVVRPNGKFKPMAFGPVGRAWQPRAKLAGTYDQRWLDSRCPFWPDDFDYLYFQSAPANQQMPYPTGGEEVILVNLSKEGTLRFRLPRLQVPVLLVPVAGRDIPTDGTPDTVVIEPNLRRLTMTWRVSHPLRRNLFELRQVIVGQDRRESLHKKYKRRYANIGEYIRQRKRFAVK